MRVLRRVGIAFGSLVIAWLVVSLVGGVVLGPGAFLNAWAGVIIVVLGGLIFADIIRRERRGPAPRGGSPR